MRFELDEELDRVYKALRQVGREHVTRPHTHKGT